MVHTKQNLIDLLVFVMGDTLEEAWQQVRGRDQDGIDWFVELFAFWKDRMPYIGVD